MSESKEIVMCWILSYVGIMGNSKAYLVAKYVMNKEIDKNFKIPYTEELEESNKDLSSENGYQWLSW